MSGIYFNPLKRVFLNLSGGTVTGDTVFTQGLYATYLSGGTFYSGATPLAVIIQNIAASVVSSSASTLATYVQPGTNITTGGTALAPIINTVDSPSFNSLYSSGTSQFNNFGAVSISGGTINSGSTNLQSIFNSISTDIQNLSILTNAELLTKANLSGATFTGPVVGTSLSATSISAGTLSSGSTDLYNIFQILGTDINTAVQPGTNITTGGTANAPTINLVASPSVNNITFSGTAIGGTVQAGAVTATSFSAGTLSGGTILSGSTNLYSIFSTTDTNDITRVQPGTNITTGGTANAPIINLTASPSVNNLTVSGTSNNNSLSATTLSGGTILSGSTNLYSIFSTTDTNDITRVQPGSNITTGGTANAPIINLVASPFVNNITASGSSSFTILSATTFTSGSTDLNNIFLANNNTLNGGSF